jgi:ribose-phosphate pyrophosphokinase
VQRLRDSKLIKLVVTDTIPLTKEAQALGKIEVFSVAELLAEAIRRIHSADSISSLFI